MNGANYEDIVARIEQDMKDDILAVSKNDPDLMLLVGTGTGKGSGLREVMPGFLAGWLWASLEDQEEYLLLSNTVRKSRGLETFDFAHNPVEVKSA